MGNPTLGEDATSSKRRLLITSHCVLNQNAVVLPLARSAGVVRSAVDWALDQGYSIYQLPCPEFRFAGPRRLPASFDDYNTPAFHASNRELLEGVIAHLRCYVDAGYEIVGGLHVTGSPACDPDTGNWISDVLEAAGDAGIEIRQMWAIPNSESGCFDPGDPAIDFGDPARRSGFPDSATSVTQEQRESMRASGEAI